MIDFFDQSLKTLSKRKIIIDVGGGNLWQKNLFSKKHLFAKSQCYSVDQSPASEPTVRANIHYLPFKNNCCDGVICKAVLEHCQKPWVVVEEIHRVLKPGGVAYFWAPFIYPYHPNKNYGDYFRFTKQGVSELFAQFTKIVIEPSSGYFTAIVGLWPFFLPALLKPVTIWMDKWIKISGQSTGWHALVVK